MGKRELLIVIAFVVVAAVTYQFTAPPPKAGERSFSLRQIFSGIRREISANASSATVTKTGSVKIPAGVSELRVRTPRNVPLTITGERRDDIAYDMPVESTGPDEATARAWAERSELREDDMGAALALGIYFPDEGTQSARLTLRVPEHMAIRVENSARIQISHVGAVNLLNIAGEATVTDVKGAVSGSHKSGDLTVTGAGSVNLTLSSSRAKFRDVTAGLALNGRNGDCSIARSRGKVEAMMTGVELDIAEHDGPITVGGDSGRLKVTLPTQDLSVDARRMLVEVTLRAPVPASLITSDEEVRVFLTGAPSLKIDAATTDGGDIRAPDFDTKPTTQGRESRLALTLGAGTARVVVRNARGDIVISQRK